MFFNILKGYGRFRIDPSTSALYAKLQDSMSKLKAFHGALAWNEINVILMKMTELPLYQTLLIISFMR